MRDLSDGGAVASAALGAPGGMAARLAAFDWPSTPLGPREAWPAVLEHAVANMLASAFAVAIIWGREHVYLYNDATAALLGNLSPHVFGRPASEGFPELWPALGAPRVARVRATGRPVVTENARTVIERHGYPEEAFVTSCYSAIDDPGGEGGVLVTAFETTAAVNDERKFRAMADNLAAAIFVMSVDGETQWRNARYRSYLELPAELEHHSAGWQHCIAPEDHAAAATSLARSLATGSRHEIELRVRPYGADDDAYRWFYYQVVPSFGSDGRIERWLGTATDVHDAKLRELARRDVLEREVARQREASLAFQRASLPAALPSVAGLAFDAIYRAADGGTLVCGGWYDAFALPDGRVAISIGDVDATGLAAAATMAAVRQTIRGALQLRAEPAAVLDAADRGLRSERPGHVATAVVGILDPADGTLAFASAGHVPPLVRQRDGTVVELEGSGPSLGARHAEAVAPPRANVVAPLAPGALLVLTTRGLIETAPGVRAGASRARDLIARDAIARDERPAAALDEALTASAGIAALPTDVAILTVRVAEAAPMPRWAFDAGDALAAGATRAAIATLLLDAGAPEDELLEVELVFSELVGNVVRHGDRSAEVGLELDGPAPVLHVLDRGPGCTLAARLPQDELAESGRGSFIVRQLTRDFTIVPRPGGGSHARAVLRTALARAGLGGAPVGAAARA